MLENKNKLIFAAKWRSQFAPRSFTFLSGARLWTKCKTSMNPPGRFINQRQNKMSPTIIGNYIQLASHILVVLGFRSLTPEESTSIAMIIGLIGEAVGFLMTQFHATKAEDLTPLGGYKR
jgi:hypothetical protein